MDVLYIWRSPHSSKAIGKISNSETHYRTLSPPSHAYPGTVLTSSSIIRVYRKRTFFISCQIMARKGVGSMSESILQTSDLKKRKLERTYLMKSMGKSRC